MTAPVSNTIGITLCAPALLEFGSDAQKDRFLKRILSAEDIWCQGYSEPGAGSDLAAVQTRAVRDGDEYVVNGQKIWTSFAHWADMMFCLVRTDPDVKKQQGISFLLIDMNTPGITVNPIRHMTGIHDTVGWSVSATPVAKPRAGMLITLVVMFVILAPPVIQGAPVSFTVRVGELVVPPPPTTPTGKVIVGAPPIRISRS